MKKTINIQIMIITTIAIILTSVLCTAAYYRVFREEVMDDLKVYTKLLADADFFVEPTSDLYSSDDFDIEKITRYAKELSKSDIRMTLIDSNGDVVFDNVADITGLENHKSRVEIADAYNKGEGESIRRSSTINQSNFYYAIRLSDGSILRTAKLTSSIYNIFGHAFPLIVIFAIMLLIGCYIISHFLTISILKPIENLATDISSDANLENEPSGTIASKINNGHVYKELEPILSHIRMQHDNIVKNANIRQEFSANVSHELKTPLTSISGYSELIENGMANDTDTRKFAGEIHRNSDRLLTLINDILRLSELDSSQNSQIAFEPVNLYEIALTCQAMLEPTADKHEVTINVDGDSTIINANKTMMEELVYNLCDNAIRYNRKNGHVWITVKDNSLTVSDDGIGISAEHQSRIFERFFRVDKSRSKKTGGTGLGLAIVKHIVELHGAELDIVSKEGEGTTIKIQFI